MMKKKLFILFILAVACRSKQARFERFRDNSVLLYYEDTTVAHQLDESGLGIKMKNASSYDSLIYYEGLFSSYNDSVIKHDKILLQSP